MPDPSNFIDRTGDKYGKLAVLRRGPPVPSGASWVCHCACGNEITVTASNLNRGQRSCAECSAKEKRVELTGQRFGRLVVIEAAGTARSKSLWRCKCDCGNETETKGQSLLQGSTQSCGCLARERRLAANTKHGLNAHPLYGVWEGMKQRCLNPNAENFHRYGGRGINVCERWLKFENFRDDLLPTWQKGMTIDRINPNGNYEPSNIKWATRTEQSRNQERTLKIEFNGELVTIADLAQQHGLKRVTVHQRWIRGSRGAALVAPAEQRTQRRAAGWSDKKARIYNSWKSARIRCNEPKSASYALYGGRGIRFYDDWEDFEVFYAAMEATWAPGLSLDRIDVEGHYEPGNVRWATTMEQGANKRTTKFFVDTPKGRMTASQAAKEYGIKRATLVARLRLGRPIDDLVPTAKEAAI